jgi:glycosyltransferase involved in cell wall biosynthesis
MSVDITVIIPTYNRRSFLLETAASCFEGNEALDVDVVVVNEGSTDGTRALLRKQEVDKFPRDGTRQRPARTLLSCSFYRG